MSSMKFNLNFKAELPLNFDKNFDSIFICGSIEQLGDWNIEKALELQPNSDIDKWSTNIYFTNNHSIDRIEYKYFIVRKVKKCEKLQTNRFFIKYVESESRKLKINGVNNKEINDLWGYRSEDGILMRVNVGWLLENEIELRLSFYNKPLKLFSKYKRDIESCSVTILPFKIDDDNEMVTFDDHLISYREFNSEEIIEESSVSNALKNQDYYTLAYLRTFEDPKQLILKIVLNGFGENYLKLPQALLDSSVTRVELPLYSVNLKELIGYLNMELLLIKHLHGHKCSIKTNFHYDYNRPSIPAGHRGIGKTFDADQLEKTHIFENTIESFEAAHKKGAQMVEFDVVLTKDNHAVIYHDYSACLKGETNTNMYIDIGVHQLTYEELKKTKVYAHKILKKLEIDSENRDNAHLFSSEKMFPTLREVFENTSEDLAFDIEIKYPLDLEDGTNEADDGVKWMDRNKYVDIILNELLNNCKIGKRCAVLTSFDPFVCAMLQMKQNKFPVLFITNGITDKWVPYYDFRAKSTKISTMYAKADNLNGVVLHAEEIYKNQSLFEFLLKIKKDPKFLIYTWGDDLNTFVNRKLFSKPLFDAVIYDRIYELEDDKEKLTNGHS